eukprot:s5088_g2.t1
MPSRNDSHKAAFGVDGLREVSSLSRCPGVRCVVASCRAGRSFQRLRELKTAACLFDAARCTQLRGTQPVRTYVLKLFGRVVRLGWTILARGRALGLPACFQDVTSPAVKLKQPIAYELQDHLEHAAALVSDFSRSRLESRRTSVLKDSPTGTELTLPSEAVAARAKAQKAVDPPEGASAWQKPAKPGHNQNVGKTEAKGQGCHPWVLWMLRAAWEGPSAGSQLLYNSRFLRRPLRLPPPGM